MILVGVREHDADEVAFLLLEETDVGHDEIDARRGVVAEGDADIDAQPAAALFGADAVEREIHADLADAAERHEQEFACIPGHASAARGQWEHVAGADRLAHAVGSQQHQASRASIASNVPSIVRSESLTSMAPPRPVARISQAARIAAKFRPRSHSVSRRVIAPSRAERSPAGSTAKPAAARSIAVSAVSCG